MPFIAATEKTSPHVLREILVEAALALMAAKPKELPTLLDALAVVQDQLGIPESARQP